MERHEAPPHQLRRDLLAGGLTPTEIRMALRRGDLIALSPGAYIDADEYRRLERTQRYRVRVRAIAEQAPGRVVSHASAAVLHGLPLYGMDLSRVHLTRPGHGGNRRTSQRWIHAGELPDEFWVFIEGIRATSVARTLVDLGRTESEEALVVAADAAARTQAAAPEEVRRALDLAGHHSGRPHAERALALVDGRSESAGESRLRLQLVKMPLPPPELQVKVFDERGSFVGRTDAGYLDHGVLIEFDGLVKYGRLLKPGQTATEAIIEEKRREERITELGWLVLRFIWDDLRRPDFVADRVRRACAARQGWAGAIRGHTSVREPVLLLRAA